MPKRTDLKTIMIVGAGPIIIGQACEFDYSGTQAVKALKDEGYRVVLVNSNPATIMTDPEFADATYIEPITPEMVTKILEAERPDDVIVATGAVPYWPELEIENTVHAVDVWQILKGETNPGASVVIVDWRCDWVGLGVAEKLARDGSYVRLCVDGEMAGQNLQKYLRWHWAGELHKLGVEVIPYVRFFGAADDTAFFMHSLSGEAVECGGMDTLVIAQGHRPLTDLEDALRDSGIRIHTAGDCRSPRSAEEAIFEGMNVARAL